MEQYFVDKIICCLLRKQNKKLVQRNAKKKNYNVDIQMVKNDNFYSSVKETLKKYNSKGCLLFFDDRIQFLLNPKGLYLPPLDWEVLFLNGDMTKLGKKTDSKYYSTGNVVNTTCFVINKTAIDKVRKFKLETFEEQLNSLVCYTLKNSFAVFNDKANGLKEPITPESLDHAKVNMNNSGGLSLNLPNISDENLPTVSLITPISSSSPLERKMFFFTVMNFYKLDYPKDKLEWIIADDTPEDQPEQITSLLPGQQDKRIKVIKCSVKTGRTHQLSLGKKLNICCNYASSNYIVHFFEWNYYPLDSIKNRIKTLIEYPDKMCIGTTKTAVHNIIKNTSYTIEEKDKKGHPVILYEPSLAYHKTFWEFRPFHEYLLSDLTKNICVIPWSDERFKLLLNVPFDFTCTKLDPSNVNIEKSKDTLPNHWNEKLQETLNICTADYISGLAQTTKI